jgi:hypothetical protein
MSEGDAGGRRLYVSKKCGKRSEIPYDSEREEGECLP